MNFKPGDFVKIDFLRGAYESVGIVIEEHESSGRYHGREIVWTVYNEGSIRPYPESILWACSLNKN